MQLRVACKLVDLATNCSSSFDFPTHTQILTRLKHISNESTSFLNDSFNEQRSCYLLSLSTVEWAGDFIREALEGHGLKSQPVDLGSHGNGLIVTAEESAFLKQVIQ